MTRYIAKVLLRDIKTIQHKQVEVFPECHIVSCDMQNIQETHMETLSTQACVSFMMNMQKPGESFSP